MDQADSEKAHITRAIVKSLAWRLALVCGVASMIAFVVVTFIAWAIGWLAIH